MGMRRSFKPTNIVSNGAFASVTGWTGTDGTIAAANNECTLTLTGTGLYTRLSQGINMPIGKYYVSFEIYPKYANNTLFYTSTVAVNPVTLTLPTPNVWNKVSGVFDNTDISTGTYFMHKTNASYVIGDTIKFRKIMLINLTLLFGAGNEPTLAWCNNNFPAWFDGTLGGGSFGGIGGLK